MDKETVIQKIRKLLKLQYGAETIGNSGEAFQAAKMIRKLLVEYNLSLNDISKDDDHQHQTIETSDPLSYSDQYGLTWKQNLLMIICHYNFCSLVTCSKRKQMHIVGTDANIAVVREFYNYLLQVFRRLSMERLNETQNMYISEGLFMTENKKKDFIRSYLEGVSRGLRDNYESIQPTSQETGLVVCHHELIENYMKEHAISKGRKRRSVKVRSDGFDAGFDDGLRVSLNQQLNACDPAGRLQ